MCMGGIIPVPQSTTPLMSMSDCRLKNDWTSEFCVYIYILSLVADFLYSEGDGWAFYVLAPSRVISGQVDLVDL